VDGQTGTMHLSEWELGEPIPDETYARVAADPNFTIAVRALAANFLTLGSRDKALDGMFKDAGRYVAGMCAVYLDATGGLTLPRLKELCVRSGYLGAGRARALLLYLGYLGYVEVLPVRREGILHYALTVRFKSAWGRHLRAALEAARILVPAVDCIVERLDNPAVVAAFSRFHCEDLMASARAANGDTPYIRIFLGRHAATQIVWSWLVAKSDTFPPAGPLPFSIAAAARQFSVSRAHVRRLLEDAEREGLLRRGEGTIVLLENMRNAIVFIYSTQLIRLLMAAAKTARELRVLLPVELRTPDIMSDARDSGSHEFPTTHQASNR
jgi:hypothetical protein